MSQLRRIAMLMLLLAGCGAPFMHADAPVTYSVEGFVGNSERMNIFRKDETTGECAFLHIELGGVQNKGQPLAIDLLSSWIVTGSGITQASSGDCRSIQWPAQGDAIAGAGFLSFESQRTKPDAVTFDFTLTFDSGKQVHFDAEHVSVSY